MEAALGNERDSLSLLAPSFAAALDAADALAHLRAEFRVPRAAALAHGGGSGGNTGDCGGSGAGAAAVYLCGNSLGLQPARAPAYVAAELDKWAALGVEGHFTEPRPWVTVDETVRAASERLVGAKPGAGEVAVMNGLTVNLHLFLVGFFRPTPPPPPPPPPPSGSAAANLAAPPPPRGRHKILVEAHAFPSDAHAVRSHLALHGLRFDSEAAAAGTSSLVELAPRAGEECLRTEDVEAAIVAHGPELAVVLLPGVQYYTGQFFEIERLTRAAHAAGAFCGWDLAHAAGNVELRLHEWGVDFACWCSYKYLNSGPGGMAGAFLHERFRDEPFAARPHLAGWWGARKSDRFLMATDFTPEPGVAGWMLSNPPVLAVAALRASLDVLDLALVAGGAPAGDAPADWRRLAAKRRALTGYLERLLTATLVAAGEVAVVTPPEPHRGAQLSLRFAAGLSMRAVQAKLGARGVVVDVREPNVMRAAPAPLYNTAEDVRAFVVALVDAVRELRAEGAAVRA